MKVVVAIDSFKGCVTSLEAGNAVKKGILQANPSNEVVVVPIGDGGEGSLEAIVEANNGTYNNVIVKGPLLKDITCEYGVISTTNTAVIEMATASGLNLISKNQRNPMNTTTYGVGQIIKDAIEHGFTNFIIGIGGSCTNDGGIGMLQALGFEFLDEANNQIPFGAKGIKYLKTIKTDNVIPSLKNCNFKVACDVNNPLVGLNGASHIFAPQKGADNEMVIELDKLLNKYSDLVKDTLGIGDKNYPSTGAAGGLGFALMYFLNATLTSGIDLILKETNIESFIKNSDIVVSGEGKLDEQTMMGKAPIGVSKLCKKYNKPLIAISGIIDPNVTSLNENGINSYFSIINTICTLEEAMDKKTALDNITSTVEQIFRLLSIRLY